MQQLPARFYGQLRATGRVAVCDLNSVADRDRNRDAYDHRNRHWHKSPDTYCNRNRHGEPYSNCERHRHGHGDSFVNRKLNRDFHREPDSDRDRHQHGYADRDVIREPHADGDRYYHRHSDRDRVAKLDTYDDADSDRDGDTRMRSEFPVAGDQSLRHFPFPRGRGRAPGDRLNAGHQ